jgi:hypothetical protein
VLQGTWDRIRSIWSSEGNFLTGKMSDEAKAKLADVPNLIQLAKIAEDKPWKLLPLGVRRTPRVAIRIQLNRILRLVSQNEQLSAVPVRQFLGSDQQLGGDVRGT